MIFNGLRLEYALEGNSNFIAQKDHMDVVLDDNGLLQYVKTAIAKLGSTNAQKLAKWKKDVAKARRIILEGVRYHIISNIHGKETPFIIWKPLTELSENINDNRKLALKEKI